MATNHDASVARARMPRRQFLRSGLVVTGTLLVGGLLQACGGSGQAPPNPPTAAPKPTEAPKPAAPAATTAPAAPAAAPAATTAPAAPVAAKPTEAPAAAAKP